MNKYLKDIFIHLDGIAMSPVYELIKSRKVDINNSKITSEAYINILKAIFKAQRISPSQIAEIPYSFSGIKDYYKSSVDLIQISNTTNSSNSDTIKSFNIQFDNLYSNYLKYINYSDSAKFENTVLKHMEGALIAPIIIYLSYSPDCKESDNRAIVENILKINPKILSFLEDISMIKDGLLTDKGNYILSRSYAYGVTASYMRTFIHIEELLLNNYKKIWIKDSFGDEYHVNRALNVWGSGKSHKNYFKKIDTYISKIFNQPLESQPKGIADMGCGDGSFLLHLNNLITNSTLRGKNLERYPLLLIGADFNEAALQQTKNMFKDNTNKPLTIQADISNPEKYAQEIKEMYSLDISDFLNVRSFLDHNRTFSSSNEDYQDFKNKTTNVFAWKNKAIKGNEIQSNLVNHFREWKKYISKHGLLALELHFIDINKIYENIGKLPITAYMATHGFSDQFIIEYEVYVECLNKAGLNLDLDYESVFPSNELKMISINLIS